MKRLILLGALASLTQAGFAQAIYDSYNGPGPFFSSGSSPRCSFADDMVVPAFPNGAATMDLGRMNVWWVVQNSAQSFTARYRIYQTIDMTSASSTTPATGAIVSSFTVNFTTPLAVGGWVTTVDLSALNISLAPGTYGVSVEYFTDSTLATYNTNVSPIFNGGTPLVGSGVIPYYRDGSVLLDGIFTLAERRTINAPFQLVAAFRPKTTMQILGTIEAQDFVPDEGTINGNGVLKDALGNVMWSGPVDIATGGAYTFDVPNTVPDGDYTLSMEIFGSTFLKSTLPVNVTSTVNVTDVNYSLRNGDSIDDGVVDLSDYNVVAVAFNALLDEDPVTTGNQSSANWNAAGDLNKDGVVDLTDYTVIATNFNALDE